MIRKLVARMAVLTAFVAPAPAFVAQPALAVVAPASGDIVAVASHNIEHDGWGGLKYVAEFDRPLMLMGQEVCADSLYELQGYIGRFNYGHSSHLQHSRASTCNDIPLYTSAWTLAPTALTSSGYHPLSSTSGWACIVGSYGSTWRSCSTHMTAQGRDIAFYQSENLRVNVVPPSGLATIVGGDFNLRPRGYYGYNTYNWRGSWDEGDDLCFDHGKDRRTLQPGPFYRPDCLAYFNHFDVKIDYTQASGYHYTGTYGVADIRCGVSSDHCLYFATYRSR